MFYADSMGFFVPPIKAVDGRPVIADQVADRNITLDAVVLTAAPPPPFAKTMAEVLECVRHCRQAIQKQDRLREVEEQESVILMGRRTDVIYNLQYTPEDAKVRILTGAGIRILGIAYEGSNVYGSGFSDPSGPLTDRGHKLLDECRDHLMILDISHSGHKTARDILILAYEKNCGDGETRIMASHTGCYGLYPHLRNLPDDVLRGVAELGGVVGITTLTFILDGERNDLEPFVEHLRYAVNICGEDAVCIGSDGWYSYESEADRAARFELMKKFLDPNNKFAPRNPDQPPELCRPDRMELIAELLAEALPSRVVDKVVGKNFHRFMESNF